jgi:predicted TPR repeat methyltransferase
VISPYESAKQRQEAGDFEAAAELYRAALEADPNDYRALNNLGVVLETLGHSGEAADAYRQALAIRPDLAAIHYNLGHLHQTRGEMEEAIACYQSALELKPEHVAARYNLGNALRDLDRLEGAEAAYRVLLESESPEDNPEFFKIPSNLGQVLCEQGRFAEAESAFRRALALQPNSAEEQANLGRCLARQGNPEAAKEAYERALALDPVQREAREGLAELHRNALSPEQAAAVYAELLKLAPGEPIAEHMLAAHGAAETPSRASDRYVETVFDSFANSFDRVLKRLRYRAPQVLAEAVAAIQAPDGQWEVLDAGCGTGLCQSWLRPYAQRLIGVDLSEKMLDKARQRGGYDDLVKAELTAYLAEPPARYDLIVSADTLVYFGALDAVIANAAMALKPGGWLAFTVERLDDNGESPDFYLNPHGRYSHGRDYVEQVLKDAGLELRSLTTEVLRLEQNRPVEGWVVVAGRH